MTDHEVLDLIERVFGGAPRPEHFADYTHCCECAEHDELLRARDVTSLSFADVGNPGWDPLCFISAEGFCYYFPALARLALDGHGANWYVDQLLFHLGYGGTENRHLLFFSQPERDTVLTLLQHINLSRAEELKEDLSNDELQEVIRLWGGTPA
jgi:hypothetical protein